MLGICSGSSNTNISGYLKFNYTPKDGGFIIKEIDKDTKRQNSNRHVRNINKRSNIIPLINELDASALEKNNLWCIIPYRIQIKIYTIKIITTLIKKFFSNSRYKDIINCHKIRFGFSTTGNVASIISALNNRKLAVL